MDIDAMITVDELQARLAALGFDPGAVDGIRGPKTERALREYESSRGTTAKETVVSLFPNLRGPDWYLTAAYYVGVREQSGSAHNPIIMNWAEEMGVPYGSDEVAWCGLFVGFCLYDRGRAPVPGRQMLSARRWRKWGQPAQPGRGAILVFWRKSPSDWRGHVGMYVSETETHYNVLGGNQGNQVSVVSIPKERLLRARVPEGFNICLPPVWDNAAQESEGEA